MVQDFLTALLLFVVVVVLMILLAPFAPFVLGAIVLIVAMLVVYYLRVVVVPLGVVFGGLYLLWTVATSIRIPSFTPPSISFPAITFPTISPPAITLPAIQLPRLVWSPALTTLVETVLFIFLIGFVMYALMLLLQTSYGSLERFWEERRREHRGTYFVMDEVREEREQVDPQPTRQPDPVQTQTVQSEQEPEPEPDEEQNRYWRVDPVHSD